MTASVEVEGRPRTTNATPKGGSHWTATSATKQWRTDFAWAAKAKRLGPVDTPVIIHARQNVKGRRPDAGAIFHAVKAGVDGLVDVGVLPDDGPDYVHALILHVPVKADRDSLILELESVSGEA